MSTDTESAELVIKPWCYGCHAPKETLEWFHGERMCSACADYWRGLSDRDLQMAILFQLRSIAVGISGVESRVQDANQRLARKDGYR